MNDLVPQPAQLEDLKDVCKFTDYWLAGRGLAKKIPGAVNDCFISPSQHKKYIVKYKTILIRDNLAIVGWAVIQHDGSLIHFLIAGTHRHRGLGSAFLQRLNPHRIHSKSNQSSGNPTPFYLKMGYELIESRQSKSRLDIDKIRPDRKKVIDILKRTER